MGRGGTGRRLICLMMRAVRNTAETLWGSRPPDPRMIQSSRHPKTRSQPPTKKDRTDGDSSAPRRHWETD